MYRVWLYSGGNHSAVYCTIIYYTKVAIKYSWQGCIMYSGYYGSAPTIPLFIIPLFTIQKPIVLSFTIQKSSWQGILLYSTLYTSAPAIQQFTIQLFTIQEWTSFTPGKVYSCIVCYCIALSLLYSWQGYTIFTPGRVI